VERSPALDELAAQAIVRSGCPYHHQRHVTRAWRIPAAVYATGYGHSSQCRGGVISSISTEPPRPYPAPSPHGDLALTGLRGWLARRPLTGFLVIALGLTWLLLSIPVLAFDGVIPGANLPVEVFALAATLLILLPTALWVTSITDCHHACRIGQRVGSRCLASDLRCQQQQWRLGGFPVGWCRCRPNDPACSRRADSAGRRVAALATAWDIRQTPGYRPRFLPPGWVGIAGRS
jgi:hypothetical protein